MTEGNAAAEQRRENNPPDPHADHFGDPLPIAALMRLGTVRLRETEAIASIAFSPDGHLLASGREDGLIRFWDPITGQAVREIGGDKERLLFRRETILPPYPFVGQEMGGDQDRLLSIAFSVDGKVLASLGKKALCLWDVASGKEIRKIPCSVPSPDLVSPNWQPDVPVVFSPDCQLVASIAVDHAIHVWEISTRQREAIGRPRGSRSKCLGFHIRWENLAGSRRDQEIENGSASVLGCGDRTTATQHPNRNGWALPRIHFLSRSENSGRGGHPRRRKETPKRHFVQRSLSCSLR